MTLPTWRSRPRVAWAVPALLALVACDDGGLDGFAPPSDDPVSSGAPSRAAGPVPGLVRLWYVGRNDLIVGSLFEAVVEFDDGRVTTDIDTVVTEGAAASLRANPGRWGTSRVSDGSISYRMYGRTSEVDNWFSFATRPAEAGQRLSGCYGSGRGFATGGGAISVNVLCLTPDGRFSNDRAVTASTPAGSGSANSQVTGAYRLDGHAIRLDYDDGKTLTTTFGTHAVDGEIQVLLVGERVLDR